MRQLIFIGGAEGDSTAFFPCHPACVPFSITPGEQHSNFCDLVDEGDTDNHVFQDFVKRRLCTATAGIPRLFWGTRSGLVYRIKHLQLKAMVQGTQRFRHDPVCFPTPYCDGTYLIADRPYFAEDTPDDIVNF